MTTIQQADHGKHTSAHSECGRICDSEKEQCLGHKRMTFVTTHANDIYWNEALKAPLMCTDGGAQHHPCWRWGEPQDCKTGLPDPRCIQSSFATAYMLCFTFVHFYCCCPALVHPMGLHRFRNSDIPHCPQF